MRQSEAALEPFIDIRSFRCESLFMRGHVHVFLNAINKLVRVFQ